MTQAERLEVVAGCRYVDEALADGPKVITLDFMYSQGYSVYAYAYAHDQEKLSKRRDCPDLPDDMIALLQYTPGISTTEILERVRRRNVPCQAEYSSAISSYLINSGINVTDSAAAIALQTAQ